MQNIAVNDSGYFSKSARRLASFVEALFIAFLQLVIRLTEKLRLQIRRGNSRLDTEPAISQTKSFDVCVRLGELRGLLPVWCNPMRQYRSLD